MTTFDDRENAFEAKFAHDSEMQFRAEARRNKLVGLWAAGLMGKTDEAAAAYALEVVSADFEEAGDEDVVRKVVADLAGKASAEASISRRSSILDWRLRCTRSRASALGPLHDTCPCSITTTRSHSSRAWDTCCSITSRAVPAWWSWASDS